MGWLRKKADKLPGGLGDQLTPADVDPQQLEQGIKIEREHTDDPELAKEIALDHLAEDPQYYTKLKEIEHENGEAITGPDQAAAGTDIRVT